MQGTAPHQETGSPQACNANPGGPADTHASVWSLEPCDQHGRFMLMGRSLGDLDGGRHARSRPSLSDILICLAAGSSVPLNFGMICKHPSTQYPGTQVPKYPRRAESAPRAPILNSLLTIQRCFRLTERFRRFNADTNTIPTTVPSSISLSHGNLCILTPRPPLLHCLDDWGYPAQLFTGGGSCAGYRGHLRCASGSSRDMRDSLDPFTPE